jgi:Putative peptidoglycan binding domain/N-acetylmuramoyl-L-alanine amidase
VGAPGSIRGRWSSTGRRHRSPARTCSSTAAPTSPARCANFELLPGNDGVKLVAAGKANHAGKALIRFTNSVSFGIEAAGPPIDAEEFKVYHALVAAICRVYDIPVGQGVRDHHEVAPTRKVDISGKVQGLTLSSDHNMNVFRDKVARLLKTPDEPLPPRPDGKLRYPGLRKIGMFGAPSGPGAFIAFIQRRLNAWEVAHPPLSVDGDFGDKTRDAVVAFQKKRHISPANGEVEAHTWYALQDKPK